MKSTVLFVTNLYNIKIRENLDTGLLISDGITITNHQPFINSLVQSDLKTAIGTLETNALLQSNAVFYRISDIDDIETSYETRLVNFLSTCRMILTEFWMIKDHSIDMMLGFVNFPYQLPGLILQPAKPKITHSNMISGRSSKANGDYNETIFTREEIQTVIKRTESVIFEDYENYSNSKTMMLAGRQRVSLANTYLQIARQHHDLGVKIAQYCSAFECLFAGNSTTELTFRLSLRIAYFLTDNPKERIEIFEKIKTIYDIRSKVVHGSIVPNKTLAVLGDLSVYADSILRRIMIKIHNDPRFDKLYRSKDRKDGDIDGFWNNIVMGHLLFEGDKENTGNLT